MAQGGKTKEPDARTVAVKLPQHERGLLLDLCHRRVMAGRPYDETTQAGVVKDALRLLHLKETGGGTDTLPVPPPQDTGDSGVASVPEVSDFQMQKEYAAFTKAEGVPELPWDQFLTIRKIRIQKGAWKYGPNPIP